MKKEYVIWGKAPNSSEETLLVSERAGLKTIEAANRALASLESKHGCKDCRVQVIDFSEPSPWNAKKLLNI